VLEPELRTTDGAESFSQHLLTKAAERLRRGNYYGRGAIGFGLLPSDVRGFRGHAAFHRVPEAWEF
jgi:hypothetical protein